MAPSPPPTNTAVLISLSPMQAKDGVSKDLTSNESSMQVDVSRSLPTAAHLPD